MDDLERAVPTLSDSNIRETKKPIALIRCLTYIVKIIQGWRQRHGQTTRRLTEATERGKSL